MTSYNAEKEGQIAFYDYFREYDDTIPILEDNTDGVIKGTILEFKLIISNINAVLFQSIKYLSKMRNNGKNIPSQILLISLNEEKAFLFNSNDFLTEIEEQYTGAASVDNNTFATTIAPKKINYKNNKKEITKILECNEFLKVNIDIYCVAGYASAYYAMNPENVKLDFFNEIRNPKQLSINKWEGQEEDFKYIMDLLNDKQHKKELGAFYTPKEYVQLSTKLVRQAIKQIPKENDYIILDRCAGTGNLEQFLTDKDVKDIRVGELNNYLDNETIAKYLQDKKETIIMLDKNMNEITLDELEQTKTSMTIYDYLFDNEMSHCIVNTYELKEWVVLNRLIGDKVKCIIPPALEKKKGGLKWENGGLLTGGDALSEYFVMGTDNLDSIRNADFKDKYEDSIKLINDCVANEKCNVIMLENPPYNDSSADNNTNKQRKTLKESFIFKKMSERKKDFNNSNISTIRDISNQFIWSGYEFYLKKENDCYVLFSPIKYWKSLGLSNKTFIDGYLFNRKYFHATSSSISCILWKNINDDKKEVKLKVVDINSNEKVFTFKCKECGFENHIILNTDFLIKLNHIKDVVIKKSYKTFETLYERRDFETDKINNVYCEGDGKETKGRKCDGKSYYNDNILGYMIVSGFTLDANHINLLRTTYFGIRGFYLREDNFVNKLSLFCAKLYPQEKWYERDVYFTTADKGEEYIKDKEFLKSCLIYTCLSFRNKCRTFVGSDNQQYNNELTFNFDSKNKTKAEIELEKFTLNDTERKLLDKFKQIRKESKCPLYYGTYQIDDELNTCYRMDANGTKIYKENDKELYDKLGKNNVKLCYDNSQLNTSIENLKIMLKEYYKNEIQNKLFEYELLK